MLLSTKFVRFSKSLRLPTAHSTCINKYINADSSVCSSQACLHTLSQKLNKSCISGTKFDFYNPAQTVVGSLRYSTEAEEVPPLPPPPPPESDVFGTMGGMKYETVELDSDEQKAEERLKTLGARVPRKMKPSPGQYAEIMKTYIMKGDIASAENVISECKKNHDRPTSYMLHLLIRGFALQGDVKNSYKYFKMLKDMRYPVRANTYTSLFNACANSPLTDKALNYLERVRKYMDEHNASKNHTHYNVLVRAYGQHGKYDEALKLFQEMTDNKMRITISTMNSLMFAANSNVECGLKHILHVWQLTRKLKLRPDLFTYNLLLRGIRDTNFGDCTIQQVLLPNAECPAIVTDDNRPDLLLYPPMISSLPFKHIYRNETLLLDAPKAEAESTESTESVDSTSLSTFVQNELPPEIANLDLDAVLKQNKLILFGGLDGIINKMKNDRVQPNTKTVTYLMELAPGSVAAENEIVRYARSEQIPLDIDFYNMLIKKRALRGAKKEAKEVLDDIHLADLKPNIVTYGVLALACETTNESRELLKTMKGTHHTINKYVADSVLNSAFLRRDFVFILEVMEILRRERVRLDDSTFEKFDVFQQKMSALVKMKSPIVKKEYFKVGFAKFNLRYKSWQEDMKRKIMTERVTKDK